LRGQARCAPGGDIAGRVRGGLAAAVDPVELLLGIARKDEMMVLQVLVGAVEAEVEDDARTGRFASPPAVEQPCRVTADQLPVVRTASMLETTALSAIRSPSAISSPCTRPPSISRRCTSAPARSVTPRTWPKRASAAGTARVPPFEYQTPAPTCMCAIAHSAVANSPRFIQRNDPHGAHPNAKWKPPERWRDDPVPTAAKARPEPCASVYRSRRGARWSAKQAGAVAMMPQERSPAGRRNRRAGPFHGIMASSTP
jgi:hypothetical protein